MSKDYLEKAKFVLRTEAKAIAEQESKIDEEFERAVETISQIKGKVIVTGVGKSGIIGRKISSTLSSTGTPSFFLHAGEAQHGDLGVISKDDALLITSNSGETEEIIHLIPYAKRMNIPIIGLIGKADSKIAKKCDIAIITQVKEEGCPIRAVPITSAIVTTALGDALAVALLVKRGFEEKDFAWLHPGGTIGKRLLTRVSDIMHSDDEIPLINCNRTMKEALFVMTQKRLGVVGILDSEDELVGVITDGDLRRGLEKADNFLNRSAKEIMTTNPKWIDSSSLAIDALNMMESYAITNLFVYNGEKRGKPVGVIHIHDILKYGIML